MKFFGPEIEAQQQESAVEILDKLACKATKRKILRFSRAKNVKGKWKYLVQQGENDVQEMEIIVCDRNEELSCRTGAFDPPYGKTECRQIFSTRKLLSIDENGIIGVDSFKLPSACLCKYIPSSPFRTEIKKTKLKPQCDGTEKPLTEEIISLNDNGKLSSLSLKEASEKIIPCEGTKEFCDDELNYPSSEINELLGSNLTQNYFEDILTGHTDNGCLQKRAKIPSISQTTETDQEDFVDGKEFLCAYKEKQEFPTKAKNISGKWKYIINTENYRQIVATQTCRHFSDEKHSKSCTYGAGREGNHPEATKCKQLYFNQKMLSISEDGSIEFDTFTFPSNCACHIVDESFIPSPRK